jgi:YHS domain-containing protein
MTQMDMVFGKPGEMATDPVCGMQVPKGDPRGGTHEHAGQTYYFCAPGCRTAFAADPDRFLAEGPTGHMPGHGG